MSILASSRHSSSIVFTIIFVFKGASIIADFMSNSGERAFFLFPCQLNFYCPSTLPYSPVSQERGSFWNCELSLSSPDWRDAQAALTRDPCAGEWSVLQGYHPCNRGHGISHALERQPPYFQNNWVVTLYYKKIVLVSKMANYYFLIPLISTSYPNLVSTNVGSGNSSCMGGTSEREVGKDNSLSQIKLQKKVLEISYVERSSLCSLFPWCHISKEDGMKWIPNSSIS